MVVLIVGLSVCIVMFCCVVLVEDCLVSGVWFVVFGVLVLLQVVSVFGDVKLLLGVENVGKLGYYIVKFGDMLICIVLDNGQNWCDFVKWNSLDKLNLIEVGQVLCVVVLGIDFVVVVMWLVMIGKVEICLLDGSSKFVVSVVLVVFVLVVLVLVVVCDSDDEFVWGWLVSLLVSVGFDEQCNKGLDFNGKVGEFVLVVVDGCVMYVGFGLCGYGNMVIIKYNNSYFMVYVYNQILLVKEDQVVCKGQKIVEMGFSDVDQVMLYFEVCK